MLTLEQVRGLKHGQTLYSTRSQNRKGVPHRVRITGAVKLWARDAGRVRVPWKFGLYEYGAVTENDLADWALDEASAKSEYHARHYVRQFDVSRGVVVNVATD